MMVSIAIMSQINHPNLTLSLLCIDNTNFNRSNMHVPQNFICKHLKPQPGGNRRWILTAPVAGQQGNLLREATPPPPLPKPSIGHCNIQFHSLPQYPSACDPNDLLRRWTLVETIRLCSLHELH